MHNSYTFSGSAATGSISNYHWEYRIKLKNNKNKIIKTATTPTFTIPPLFEIEEDYETDSYGDILGEIYLRGTVNGKIHYNTYNLYIEKEPDEIKYSYKILGIDEWYYKMEVTVQSIGAKEFTISVMDWEEDFTTSKRYITDDYLKFKTATLTYDSQIFFSFKTKNEYGSTSKDVIIPPIKYEPNTNNSNNNRIYNVLTSNGNLLKKVELKEDIYRLNLNNGLYIIHEIDKKSNALLNTSKVFIYQ